MARKKTTFQNPNPDVVDPTRLFVSSYGGIITPFERSEVFDRVDTDILRRRIALDQLDGWFGMGRQAEAYRFWRAIPEAGTIAESEALAGAR